MNNFKTISVEPAKLTLADQKNKERNLEFLRTNVLEKERNESSSINFMNLVLPLQKTGTGTFNQFSLPMRTVFSALLIIAGMTTLNLSSGTAGSIMGLGIVEIILGGFLALGFMTRVSMAVSTMIFAAIGILSLRTGFNDIASFSLMFGSMLFCLTGSGRYSLDFFIRRSIIRRLAERRRRKNSRMLSYKAFSYATQNL